MRIFNYHPQTGEFLSESLASVDPMNEERHLIPLYATTVEPPEAQERKARIIRNDAWEYVDDYRGVKVEAQDGTQRFGVITALGLRPEDITFEPMEEIPENPVKTTKNATLEEQVSAILKWILTLDNIPEELRSIATYADK